MAKLIKDYRRKQADYLEKGEIGGIILCVILASQFLFSIIYESILFMFPKMVSFLVSLIITLLAVLVVRVLNAILMGKGKKTRAFFLLSYLSVLINALIAHQFNNVFGVILLTWFFTLAIDYLGKYVWILIKKHKISGVLNIVSLVLSCLVIILFSLFFHLDNFGKSRIEFYLNSKEVAGEDLVDISKNPDFFATLENGTYEVESLSYGPKISVDQKKDKYSIPENEVYLETETVDLSYAQNRESFWYGFLELLSDYDFKESPIAGKIWYPQEEKNCPTLFIVHGAHTASDPSYLGYEYLGEHLASYGYVVISVDENIINEIDAGNNVRALLLLENMKAILLENEKEGSPIYGLIDEEKLAIAGHSRGGEMVATAYLFNGLDRYPENGNVAFDYGFNISAIVAIAPTVDQYMPSGHAVRISDVDYLLIHGSNDQDVSMVMGEKQYNNVSFENKDEFHMKASVYIMGANHGQFNSEWGRYDLAGATNGFINTNYFLDEKDQKTIAKAYIKTFLDHSLCGDDKYLDMLKDNIVEGLPNTVYITNYMDSAYERMCSFDKGLNLLVADDEAVSVACYGMSRWRICQDLYGNGQEGENYVLECLWKEGAKPYLKLEMPYTDFDEKTFSFRIADKREDVSDLSTGLVYSVTLLDANGEEVKADSPVYVYPSLAVQLYKTDTIFNQFEYKHQMQTVEVDKAKFSNNAKFDFSKVRAIKISLDGSGDGQVIIDDICLN